MNPSCQYIFLLIAIGLSSLKVQATNDQPKPLFILAENDREELQEELEFYSAELGLDNSAIIKVIFTLKLPEKKDGLIQYQDNGPGVGRHQMVIWINRRSMPSTQSLTLAHELVHAAQYMAGELVKISDHKFQWKGKEYKTLRMFHRERPWEKDANERAVSLREGFLEYQKQKQQEREVLMFSGIHPFPEAL